MAFYFLDEVGSTIDEARDPRYVHGDVVAAEYQTAGRGQRGNRWSSASGLNLMFSLVLDASFLAAAEQFLLLQSVALGLADTFIGLGLDARIKWTNDIYVGDRKITGVLIDNTIKDGRLVRSGVGVGVNVNQTVFDEWIPNPTSLALETGREHDRREVLGSLYDNLMVRFEALRGGRRGEIADAYHTRIYRLDTPSEFSLPGGERFTGIVRGVEPHGGLIVEGPGGVRKSYLFGEISFII